jgi:DNA repair exonuclease SbcCD ATPase subunit
MTNEELLLAMSDLLDVKLRAELQPLKNELHEEIRAVRDELHAEIQAVKNELHTEIQAVKNELRLEIRAVKDVLHAEIQAVRDELHAEIQAVRNELDEKIQSLDARVLQLQLNQDTVIMPTLNDIASCYTDTFKRYQAYGDKMDSVYENVNLLKKVVMDHSAKLQKLA